MTFRPETQYRSRPRTRTRTRTSTRATTRRLSPCYRHPDEPVTGICASCLRERLSGLDSATASPPELRRCRSVVSSSKCEAPEPRRKSCDVVSGRSSLSNLFDDEDVNKRGSVIKSIVESKNIGSSRVTYTVIGSEIKDRDEIRVSETELGISNADCEEGEFKTMKEYIDLEIHDKGKKPKDLKGIAGNIWGAASVFSKKLWKLGQRNGKMKRMNGNGVVSGGENLNLCGDEGKMGSDVGVGRRSYDTEPRFSVDEGRISFEEARASWDGYMIARTIPRLAPMFVENGILGNVGRFENRRLSVDGTMHSILEDETSSGGSGNSNSDSSSSMRRSSFDRSSSVRSFGKKAVGGLEDHGVSPANVKLVITEKELKDWRLSSSGDDDGLEKLGSVSKDYAAANVGSVNVNSKKSVKWRKVCNVFGFKPKSGESKCDNVAGNVLDFFIDDASEKSVKEAAGNQRDVSGWKLTRSGSVASSRNTSDLSVSNYRRKSVDSAIGFGFKGREEIKLQRNSSVRHSSADLDDGIKPFYMTPLRSLRNSKSGKFQLLHTAHPVAGNVFQLN